MVHSGDYPVFRDNLRWHGLVVDASLDHIREVRESDQFVDKEGVLQNRTLAGHLDEAVHCRRFARSTRCRVPFRHLLLA